MDETTQTSPTQRLAGTVKWYSYSRGYGYITTETAGDVFVHRSDADGPLRQGQSVTLEVTLTARGLRAIRVQRVKSVLETRLETAGATTTAGVSTGDARQPGGVTYGVTYTYEA